MYSYILVATIFGWLAAFAYDAFVVFDFISYSKQLKRSGYSLWQRMRDPMWRFKYKKAATDVTYSIISSMVVGFVAPPFLAALIGPWVGIGLSAYQHREAKKDLAARGISLQST